MSDWYYILEGKEQGPLTEEDIRHIFNSHALPLSTPVWREGMDDWIEAAHVAAFQGPCELKQSEYVELRLPQRIESLTRISILFIVTISVAAVTFLLCFRDKERKESPKYRDSVVGREATQHAKPSMLSLNELQPQEYAQSIRKEAERYRPHRTVTNKIGERDRRRNRSSLLAELNEILVRLGFKLDWSTENAASFSRGDIDLGNYNIVDVNFDGERIKFISSRAPASVFNRKDLTKVEMFNILNRNYQYVPEVLCTGSAEAIFWYWRIHRENMQRHSAEPFSRSTIIDNLKLIYNWEAWTLELQVVSPD